MFILKPDVDVVNMLRSAGYSSYRIAKEGIFGSATMQKFRKHGRPSWEELDKLVKLLHVSPVDLIAFQADDGTITTFDSIPATPIVPSQEPIQAAPEPTPEPAPAAALAAPQTAQATQPQPDTTPATPPDNLLQVPLSPDMVYNMDGAIRCGYSSDRVQYAIRAINTQIQQDIAAEKEKRRSRVQPAMSYTYDPYFDDDPPDDY